MGDPSDNKNSSGFVPWPDGRPPQYNGNGWPCDMWIGPCSCGATHTAQQRERELLSDDENWSLTTDKIERVLAEVRKTPCPRSACCMDDVDRVRFSLHIIAEKALAELLEQRATQAASAGRMRAVVREAVIGALGGVGATAADRIADRVAAQLTAPPPGHVCPPPYGIGPDDVDALSELAVHAEMADWPRAREALDKILAAHRPPDPAVGPLPEVIACGTEGCVSSIKKSYLPSGWLLCDGTWRCPRCKVVATTEAS